MSHTDLRELIRDPQYWRRSPEGDALRAKVARGFAERYPGPMRRDATGRQSDSGADGHVVHVRSYSRREQDGGTHTVRAHDRRAVARAWERQPNADWRVEIAREESSGGSRPDHGYGLTRGSGDTRALGRSQKPANIPGSRTDLSVFNATLDRLTRFSQVALPAPGFR